MYAACFEIYCENVRDLLNSSTDQNLKLLTSKKGTVIKNLYWEHVKSSQDLSTLLEVACDNKTYKKTSHNDRSSRSHTVFQIKI
jgi:kinesin family protein C1